jgi:hypothetical protein
MIHGGVAPRVEAVDTWARASRRRHIDPSSHGASARPRSETYVGRGHRGAPQWLRALKDRPRAK